MTRPRLDFETARKLALALPGVSEGTSYGTPAFRVNKKLLARFHQNGESLVVKCDLDEREILLSANPAAFFITDHYAGYPWVLVRLSNIRREELRELLLEAWKKCASKRQLEQLPEADSGTRTSPSFSGRSTSRSGQGGKK